MKISNEAVAAQLTELVTSYSSFYGPADIEPMTSSITRLGYNLSEKFARTGNINVKGLSLWSSDVLRLLLEYGPRETEDLLQAGHQEAGELVRIFYNEDRGDLEFSRSR